MIYHYWFLLMEDCHDLTMLCLNPNQTEEGMCKTLSPHFHPVIFRFITF